MKKRFCLPIGYGLLGGFILILFFLFFVLPLAFILLTIEHVFEKVSCVVKYIYVKRNLNDSPK